MLVELSYGEALDRLSILEIKMSEITNMDKRKEIQKEIDSLSELKPIKDRMKYYYTLALFVNRCIWDFTNNIKKLRYRDPGFAESSHMIFEMNQSRFRVKTILNKLTDGLIHEQKSYNSTQVYVSVEPNHVSNLLTSLSFLSLQYDIVNIRCNDSIRDYISKNIPAFNYVFNNGSTDLYVDLNEFLVFNNDKITNCPYVIDIYPSMPNLLA